MDNSQYFAMRTWQYYKNYAVILSVMFRKWWKTIWPGQSIILFLEKAKWGVAINFYSLFWCSGLEQTLRTPNFCWKKQKIIDINGIPQFHGKGGMAEQCILLLSAIFRSIPPLFAYSGTCILLNTSMIIIIVCCYMSIQHELRQFVHLTPAFTTISCKIWVYLYFAKTLFSCQ